MPCVENKFHFKLKLNSNIVNWNYWKILFFCECEITTVDTVTIYFLNEGLFWLQQSLLKNPFSFSGQVLRHLNSFLNFWIKLPGTECARCSDPTCFCWQYWLQPHTWGDPSHLGCLESSQDLNTGQQVHFIKKNTKHHTKRYFKRHF